MLCGTRISSKPCCSTPVRIQCSQYLHGTLSDINISVRQRRHAWTEVSKTCHLMMQYSLSIYLMSRCYDMLPSCGRPHCSHRPRVVSAVYPTSLHRFPKCSYFQSFVRSKTWRASNFVSIPYFGHLTLHCAGFLIPEAVVVYVCIRSLGTYIYTTLSQQDRSPQIQHHLSK